MSCEFCNRETTTTFHHLIPKTLHTNKWFRKNFTLLEMKTRGVNLCKECHFFIHKTWDEKHLGRNLNTKELLLKEEALNNFLKFIRKQRISNG
jgi:hypothetical protein